MIRDKVLETCDEDPRNCNMYLKVDELQGKVDRMAIKCRDASKVRRAKLMVEAALKEHKIIDAVCRDMLHIIDTVSANLGNPEDVLMWCEKARGDYQRYLAEIWRGKYLSKAAECYEKTMRWEMRAPPADESVAERVLVHRYAAALNLSILEGDIRGNVSDGMKIAEEALQNMEDSCPKYMLMKRPKLGMLKNKICGLETYHVIEVIDRIKDLINDYKFETEIKRRHNRRK